MKSRESKSRSVMKAISYRVVIIISTAMVVWLWTGKIETAMGVTFVSSVVNTGLYYIHERVWDKIKWGEK